MGGPGAQHEKDSRKGIKQRKERTSQNHSIDGLFTKNTNLHYNQKAQSQLSSYANHPQAHQ
jgi:hypothetical protein